MEIEAGLIRCHLQNGIQRLIPINMQLGMYEHFAQVHAEAWSWNPWESES